MTARENSGPQTAMVFAAGLGSRMAPITKTLPKPLVRIGGETMLHHMLDRLAAAGVRRAVVNVHHLADQIEAATLARSRPEIVISDERAQLLDQAGGIKKALPLLGPKPFYICNTDAIWVEEGRSALSDLAGLWREEDMDVALLIAPKQGNIGIDWPGDFFLEPDGRLVRRADAPAAPYVYCGVGIVKPQLFAQAEGDVIRLAPYFFAAADHGRLFGVVLEGLWLHVGAPQVIAQAQAAYAAAQARLVAPRS